jgi:hypothetical protein
MNITDTAPGQCPGRLLDHALGYAALGWPVFPLSPRQKIPLYANPHPKGSRERSTCRGWIQCGRHGHGVLDATTDPEVIAAWWARTSSANIGMACGQTTGHRVDPAARVGHSVGAREAPDVVDVDVKGEAKGLESCRKLRGLGLLDGSWAQVRTPTGGWHLYFDGTAQGNGSLRGAGVDFRSAGGYVVMPPSPVVLDGAALGVEPANAGHLREYQWVEWPDLAKTGHVDWPAVRRALGFDPDRGERPANASGGDVSALVDWLAGQGEGNRNSALHWAVLRALEAGAPDVDIAALGRAGVRLGLDVAEVDKTVRSARNRFAAGGTR